MRSQIDLGHAMITLVEPHRDGLLEYNRWYEHDHAYAAVTSAPGCFAYRRFAATRRLKDLRYPANSPVADPVGTGSFVSLFWFEAGRVGEVFDYSFGITPDLVAAGRMNGDRDHVSTAVYEYLGATGRGASPVPPEIALDHPYGGLVVVWARPTAGTSVAELASWWRQELDRAVADAAGPVGQVLDFRQCDFPNGMPALTGKVDELVRCYFVDGDPVAAWDDVFLPLGDAVERGGAGTVALAAPFVPTVPGTTRYLDELW